MKSPHTSRDFILAIIHALVARGMPAGDLMGWLKRLHTEEQNRVKQEIRSGLPRNVSMNILFLVQGIERRYVELIEEVEVDGRAAAHPEAIAQVTHEYESGFAAAIGNEWVDRVQWFCPACKADLPHINPHSLVCVSCKAELQPNGANTAFIYKR